MPKMIPRIKDGDLPRSRPCGTCDGDGRLGPDKCDTCFGTGVIPSLPPRKTVREPLVVSNMVYLGIDPGVSGGLAFLGEGRARSEKMPDTDKELWEWFDRHRDGDGCPHCGGACSLTSSRQEVFAMIEKVSSSPQMGVVSAFTFGMGHGKLLMALTAAGIPFEEVTPQVWQKGLKIPQRGKTEEKTAFKNRLRQRCQQLFPDVSVTLATCDALLIAEYGRRKREGTL